MKPQIVSLFISLILFVSIGFGQARWKQLFSTGPNRPPAVEDVFDVDFDMIWGPLPTGPTPGGRWTLEHKAKIVQWREARRRFAGLIDVPLPEAAELLVLEETGAVAFPWQDTRGQQFVALVGGPVTTTHFRLRLFQTLPVPAVSQGAISSMLSRGGCFHRLPARFSRSKPVGDLNERNCAQ